MTTDDTSQLSIRIAAMNLLSMREHSAQELYAKLGKKFQAEELVRTAIAKLAQEGLQSDTRFAEAFISMRKRQGKGPLIIAMELRDRGVTGDIVSELLQPDNRSWKSLAAVVRGKKFGQLMPLDAKDKARQMRFLASRGFSSACIQYALKYTDCDHSD